VSIQLRSTLPSTIGQPSPLPRRRPLLWVAQPRRITRHLRIVRGTTIEVKAVPTAEAVAIFAADAVGAAVAVPAVVARAVDAEATGAMAASYPRQNMPLTGRMTIHQPTSHRRKAMFPLFSPANRLRSTRRRRPHRPWRLRNRLRRSSLRAFRPSPPASLYLPRLRPKRPARNTHPCIPVPQRFVQRPVQRFIDRS
jgi:hypothetical protein